MLERWSQSKFEAHLRALGLEEGRDVAIHSKLISFALRGNARIVLDAVKKVVGKQATIVVPTYTLHLGANDLYDRGYTPSNKVGLFSELVRTQHGAVRSRSPLHSHAGLGPNADLFEQSPATVSLGPGSDFELMSRSNFRLVMLGCTMNEGCTFLHHMEAQVAVPYREWIELDRKVMAEGRTGKVKVRYYARRQVELRNDFSAITRALEATGDLTSAAAPLGNSYAVDLDTLTRCAKRVLEEDPYAIVEKN